MTKQRNTGDDHPGHASEGRRKRVDETVDTDPSAATAITVVGIGASAGGIEALGSFFDAMPTNSGCAFVVVLHLDPKRESEMARILSGRTTMSVAQVEDGMALAPDHVYVIAPDTDLRLVDGGLKVSRPSEPRGQRHPVDVLFASIAAEQRERSVAIVLSGTGSDGTEGLKEIRAEGGMSLVQAPETAKFDGMPRSAILAGLADHVLAAEKMPETLLAYVQHGYVSAPSEVEPTFPKGEVTIERVLEVLRARGGHDFGSYKRNTLKRRIHRRMGLRNTGTLADYLNDLRINPEEVATLVADLMISVTGFFRDPEAWKALAELVIAPLVAERERGASVRVWVPACATGEEAYSVAMLITEHAEATEKHFDLKVFATDAQEDNLRKARDGIYPAAALAGCPPGRVRRFFEKLDGSYQVSKELRDMVVFAPQNLLRDPPFSRLDIVSCRNFLIYLEPEAQQRIIAQCHFALRPDGHLFLGNAETIGRHDDLFETVSKKWRIYRRVGPTRHDLIDYRPPRGSVGTGVAGEPPPMRPEAASPVADIARRALLERYAPASVLIDHKGRVVYFHGTTRDYLEQPSGEPTRDLLTMARDGLALKLRGAIREASKGDKSVTVHGRVHRSGSSLDVAMTVMPLPASPQGGKLALVSFAPGAPRSNHPTIREDAAETTSGVRALQEELVSMRAELRNTIEHLETANEELKASNEEATSMNEELQSTNEELETSKEELQSFNEELNTVNSQLQHKIAELERTTNDLNNLLAGSDTATLFLDSKLAINWFAPATKELFDLVTSDIGRPIAHFARKFFDENLLSDAETVLQKLTNIEAEVLSDAGRWYLRRMLPYRTRDNHIAGVVITFSDITERRNAAQAVDDARIYAEAIVGTVRQPLVVLDAKLRVQSANPAFYDLLRVAAKETEGSLLYDLGNGLFDIPAVRTLLDEVLSKNYEVADYEVEHEFRDIGRRCMLLNARKLSQGGGRDELILLAIEDITERREGDNAVRASEQRLRDLIEALPGAVYTTDAEGRITSCNPAAAELWGRNPELGTDEWCGSWRMYRPDGTPLPHDESPMAIALKENRQIQGAEAVAERPDGVRVPFLAYPTPLRDASGKVIGAVNMLVDITERKRAEALAERLAAIVESSDDAIISKTLDGTITSWNDGAERLFGYGSDEIIGNSIMTLVPPDRRDEEMDILDRIRRGEHIQHYETLRQRKDGSLVWVSLTISPLKDATGKAVGASKIARDITERQHADQHRKTLMDELNHRVKNSMAVIQSIASQTLGHASTLDEAREAFGSRLINLAKAHDVLTRESWQSANLVEIVSDTVKPHAGGKNRFRIEGPGVRLSPSAALAIAMALHELSTNAAKYGALSNGNGQVVIVWQIEGDDAGRRLVLHWQESGGPPVAKPKAKGFGSRLIERALASELGGEVRVDYQSSGLECTIIAPLPAGQELLGGQSGKTGGKAGADRRG
ncbi:PAS domain S-box protein [Sinorhizobium fredii]|uniref:PAS domain S-box protein n=1 Tax=Rhizobium fredii TaxID=380 RepID=UPI0004BCFCC7|nr:PAS domain S-box protein [Sinorhizobium fredii]ASY73442.1 Chemotaxis protein methyltransferase CheR [Sinorhizobium fredii CCBAU 83666]AWM29515.1 Chemotaxis protein methyltransferase CheR [Sinorhizobium fredii CCBAU 25509]MQW99024.1 PAS domain S-box protein [Sinorhizobium fredii]UTY47035.1 PAS domain S-box protein [Sinorhizobium fredii]